MCRAMGSEAGLSSGHTGCFSEGRRAIPSLAATSSGRRKSMGATPARLVVSMRKALLPPVVSSVIGRAISFRSL